MKVTVGKEQFIKENDLIRRKVHNLFNIEASGIQTIKDVEEVINQCQIIKGQMDGGLGSNFEIKEEQISVRYPLRSTNEAESAISAITVPAYPGNIFIKDRSVPTTDELKTALTIKASGISTLAKDIPLNGNIAFTQLNVASPFSLAFANLSTGEKFGELKEKDGVLTFEGKADEAARIFFNELIKNNINPKK